jgi:hypothetical protein
LPRTAAGRPRAPRRASRARRHRASRLGLRASPRTPHQQPHLSRRPTTHVALAALPAEHRRRDHTEQARELRPSESQSLTQREHLRGGHSPSVMPRRAATCSYAPRW